MWEWRSEPAVGAHRVSPSGTHLLELSLGTHPAVKSGRAAQWAPAAGRLAWLRSPASGRGQSCWNKSACILLSEFQTARKYPLRLAAYRGLWVEKPRSRWAAGWRAAVCAWSSGV